MPELQEIKSEIGGVDFGAHQGSASTTPQPHQNFQWVSPSLNLLQRASDQKTACFVHRVKQGKIVAVPTIVATTYFVGT